jgi:hypothetical protein
MYLRPFSSTISKANASLKLAVERLHFNQRNPTPIGTLAKHGYVESEPENYHGAVNTVEPRVHSFGDRSLEYGFRLHSIWLGNNGSSHR